MAKKVNIILFFLVVSFLCEDLSMAQQPACNDPDHSLPNRLSVDRRSQTTTRGVSRITGRSRGRRDYCRDGLLTEWYCDGDYLNGRSYRCPSGESCVDGACIVATGDGARGASCSTGSDCQSGFCDLGGGHCEYQPIGGACNDASQCGAPNNANIQCHNYQCLMVLNARCERDNECISGYCAGEYCYGGQGAPRICFSVCSLAPIGARCENGSDCISGNCSEIPNDPSHGGSVNGGPGPNCHALFDEVVDSTPPCHPSICGEQSPAANESAESEPPPPECIKVCRGEEASIAYGAPCSSHANVDYDRGDECINENDVCRPFLNRRTRIFYNIRQKKCVRKLRNGDGCWYDAHCQSGVCSNGRCQ